jgi:Mlc titration factor MtfA (ptsG expression regulator)
VIRAPLKQPIRQALHREVAFFRALSEDEKRRFEDLVKVFLDEVQITGIKTDVDDTTRALVAASAIIPIFGFDDWEYGKLGEVLIYPSRFGEDFSTSGDQSVQRHTLGMVGAHHLSGVMILSKPDLLAGFRNSEDKRNVGIHEFAHLVDQSDGSIDGLPAGVPQEVVRPWIQWVANELRDERKGRHHIDDYAYTNEAEYFAVLTEYFFESPDQLARKAPKTYEMLEKMYRQSTKTRLASVPRFRKRVGRNDRCPCGSGKKYKDCCRRKR